MIHIDVKIKCFDACISTFVIYHSHKLTLLKPSRYYRQYNVLSLQNPATELIARSVSVPAAAVCCHQHTRKYFACENNVTECSQCTNRT